MKELSDGEKLHFDSVLVDLHAHHSFNVSLFHRALKILGGNALHVLLEGWKR